MTTRRQYAGGATAQTLQAPITSVATTATLSDNAGWPTGSVGPFSIVIDRGLGTEEKVLVSAQAANTLTIQTRGYDGTGSQAHAAGATVECCATAVDADEANAHTSANAGVHGVSGQVVGDTDPMSLTNKVLIVPIIADFTGAGHNHSSAATGGTLSSPTLNSLTYSAGFANTGGAFALGGWRVNASGEVALQGAVGASSGSLTIATALPAPADALSHSFPCVDLTSNGGLTAVVSATGVLSLSSVVSGHSYSLDSIKYQS